MTLRHLAWIPAGAGVGFLASLLFGDLLTIPVDVYYLIYLTIIVGFFGFYVKRTGLDLRAWVARRMIWGIVVGLAVGTVMIRNVLSRPETELLTGGLLAWAILWRGVVYGAVDGLLLFAFPWIVTWRAFGAEVARPVRKVAAAVVAWMFTLLVTTLYHLGYADFRSPKIVQPNIGNAIMAVPTLVTANPVASPISHVLMHIAAVVHSPYTELFLPPHRGMAQDTPPDAR